MIVLATDQLQYQLSQKHSIKCFVDIADLTESPSQAYKILQQHYQQEFSPADRLVFYTKYDISDQLIRHLYQAATLIDVSNFFLLLCTPTDISDRLISIAKENSGDQSSFQSLQVEIENTKLLSNNFVLSDAICPMPWMHMMINQSGGVKACCVYNTTIGNIVNNSINEVFHNQHYVQLRQHLLAGEKVAECDRCWNLEDRGSTSNRLRHLSFLKKDLLTKYLDSPTISSLDLSPGNTCNFKCRICNPDSSSLFAQEVQSVNKLVPVKSFNWAESNATVIDEISNLMPSLTNLDMYGGEPFLIKPLVRLLQQAIEQGQSEHIRLHYNSNGSVYPEHLIEYWKKFKHIDIQFSIDNVGKRFELERGGQWKQVHTNISKLVDLGLPNLKISIMPTISIMNILYLDEILRWAKELGLTVNFNYLDTPEEFNIKNLTAAAKKLIFDKFQNYPEGEIHRILDTIRACPDSDGKKFVNLSKHFDQIRNQNFSETHQEIAHAMGM
jgi:MoaA/NifB/PqqE/SkfB family radical SAM enzyme